MTNFEKWKQSLTVDDIVSAVSCSGCPLRGKCSSDKSCEEDLRAWAEEEAEEKEGRT